MKKRVEMLEKTEQAQSDKQELMRDLATYESNFAMTRHRDNLCMQEKLL